MAHKVSELPVFALALFSLLFGSLSLAQDSSSDFDWQKLGETVFTKHCAACHQASGEGVSGAFPPLVGDAAKLGALEGGREVLIHIVLYGLTGPITVNGGNYNGAIPHCPQLSDEQIAAVLNHILTAWDNQDMLPDEFQLL